MPIEAVEKIWMDGELVDWADAKVHVLTHALHYGGGVFEGIRAYETPNGPGVFRLTDHMKRLSASAKIVMIDMPYSVEELVEAAKTTLRANGLDSCYIRPIAYLGYGEMGVNPLASPVNVSIAMWKWGAYLGDDGLANGINAKISSWVKLDHNSMPPAAKTTAMYLNASLAKVEAIKGGYDEAIMLSPQGFIAEGTGENLFIVNDGVLTTPPSSVGALEGITRHTVTVIARDLGYEVREANLSRSDLYVAQEVFMTGTAAEVTPIRSVDDRVVGAPGDVTRAIQETYKAVVHGKIDKYIDWVEVVD